VLKIEALEVIASGAYYLGDRLDAIGPGWFVTFEQLEKCKVSEVAP